MNVKRVSWQHVDQSDLQSRAIGVFQAAAQRAIMVDIQAGQHQAVGVQFAPTVTSSRGQKLAYYLPFRKTMITLAELGRLQGADPARFATWRCLLP